MKTLALAALLLISAPAFSDTLPANLNQRKLLCSSIERMLESESVDAAIDMEECLDHTFIMVEEKNVNREKVIFGRISFNSPNRSFTQTCQISYSGFFEKGILVGTATETKCL
jgi:hypothetical protein